MKVLSAAVVVALALSESVLAQAPGTAQNRPKFIWGCTDPGVVVALTNEYRLQARHPDPNAAVDWRLTHAASDAHCMPVETATMTGEFIRVQKSPAAPIANENMNVVEFALRASPGQPPILIWFRIDDFAAATGGTVR